MTPFQQKLERLLQLLESGTSDGSIEWKAAEDDEAVAQTKAGLVTIFRSKDASGQEAVAITLASAGSNKTLTFDDTSLRYQDEFGNDYEYYDRMNDLLGSALRSARGEEGLVNSFLDALTDDIPF